MLDKDIYIYFLNWIELKIVIHICLSPFVHVQCSSVKMVSGATTEGVFVYFKRIC